MRLGAVMKALSVILALSVAFPAAAAEPTAAEKKEAARRFDRGVQSFDGGDYAGALLEFEAAFELVPRYQVLFNLAVTQRKLSRPLMSYRTYERYLVEGGTGIPVEKKVAVEKELAELRQELAEVVVKVAGPPARVFVDGLAVGTSPLADPILLGAGSHSFRAVWSKEDLAEEQVTLKPGTRAAVDLASKVAKVAPAQARLTVVSRPPRAHLTVDGNDVGAEPWTGTLAPGEHLIRGVLTDHRPSETALRLEPGEERTFTVSLEPLEPPRPQAGPPVASPAAPELPAHLSLTTQPRGAFLTVDGTPMGREPWTGTVAPGDHDVLAQLDLYQPLSTRLRLEPNRSHAFVLNLVPQNLGPPVPSGTPPAEVHRPWTRRWAVWTAIGVVVGAAAAGTLVVLAAE